MNALSPSLMADTVLSSSASLDIELLHLCAELQRLDDRCAEVERSNLYAGLPMSDEAVWDRCEMELWVPHSDLSKRIADTRAHTFAGVQAKIAAMRCELRVNGKINGADAAEDDQFARLAKSLCDDLVPHQQPAHPDAELISVCAKFDELERAYVAAGDGDIFDGTSEARRRDSKRRGIVKTQGPLVKRMHALRATTAEGHAARARCIALWAPDLVEEGSGDFGAVLISAMLRDAIAAGSHVTTGA
jgi:hypothetical protein